MPDIGVIPPIGENAVTEIFVYDALMFLDNFLHEPSQVLTSAASSPLIIAARLMLSADELRRPVPERELASIANIASEIPENSMNDKRVSYCPSIRESLFFFTEFRQLC